MRENSSAKARRLLWEGRVAIVRVGPDGVLAAVKGDTAGVYTVKLVAGYWSCTCPALGPCSHAKAVQLVTVPTPWAVQPELLGMIEGTSGRSFAWNVRTFDHRYGSKAAAICARSQHT
jgi:hypothetical protein